MGKKSWSLITVVAELWAVIEFVRSYLGEGELTMVGSLQIGSSGYLLLFFLGLGVLTVINQDYLWTKFSPSHRLKKLIPEVYRLCELQEKPTTSSIKGGQYFFSTEYLSLANYVLRILKKDVCKNLKNPKPENFIRFFPAIKHYIEKGDIQGVVRLSHSFVEDPDGSVRPLFIPPSSDK